jgi:hypothetical protein
MKDGEMPLAGLRLAISLQQLGDYCVKYLLSLYFVLAHEARW